jgi:alkyl hydroperoxide reductase subunit AhpF
MQFNSLSKLAVIAGLSISAFAFGAEKAAAPAAAPAAAAAAPAAEAKAAPAVAAKAKTFSGTVVSTDAIANTIVVKNTKGEETFSIAATGKISSGKKEVKLADIAKDQKVTVKYTEEAGAKTASAVKVSAVAAKKEAKTSTAAAPQ